MTVVVLLLTIYHPNPERPWIRKEEFIYVRYESQWAEHEIIIRYVSN